MPTYPEDAPLGVRLFFSARFRPSRYLCYHYMMTRFYLLLFILSTPLIVGCEGCRRDTEEDADKTKPIPVADFSFRPAQVFPAENSLIRGAVKPGHWMTASQAIKSNKEDLRGDLESRIFVNAPSTTAAPEFPGDDSALSSNPRPDASGAARSRDRELASLKNVRPTVLPKGQSRRFDFRILTPSVPSTNQNVSLLSTFVSSNRRSTFEILSPDFEALSQEEFFFVILTTRPERFVKLQTADWRRPYRPEMAFRTKAANYRVVIPKAGELLPISETMLDWTSTAVVLWDDVASDALTPGQVRALTDWVHFGGQLIVNGANASEAISNSSAADVLPIRPSGNVELDSEAGDKLLSQWSIKTDRSTAGQIALLKSQSGRIAVEGPKAKDAEPVFGCEDLLIARRVGRGRVVQSRFDLTSDWLTNWNSFDSFVNAAILDRPRREFVADTKDNSLRHRYPQTGRFEATATMNSKFRLLSRDAVLGMPSDSERGQKVTCELTSSANQIEPFTRSDPVMGTSAWGTESDALALSKKILRQESGIEIPSSDLVIRSLGFYLLALIPLNYLLFRLLGRMEYAWLAVPVIAIVGAIWVARAARLDIGFARSQTEIALLEIQPNYQRAHLSRLMAIYNSLSSDYDFHFKTIDAVADSVRANERGPETEPVTFRTDYEEGPTLADISVGSNQTQLVRSEQIIDLGGSIRLSGPSLVNESEHEFLDAFVVEKLADSTCRVAILGTVAPGTTTSLRYRDFDEVRVPKDLPLQASSFIGCLLNPELIEPGSSRMVARIAASLPDLNVVPAASQLVAQTVVVAHLRYPPFVDRQPDDNLETDFRSSLFGQENE
ncbi:hypothetical protein Q31b_21350 [Novipirellula aureliae]|uniref:Uncharacterized protein n=1 Tax=Novipirellula aureliae TaxID=2527966 RepID=A0A5C6E2K8_9BACT|nr:hypothetical protein [Novipirellula aureliae]TWU43098.1 hypothetical protein Q31b_21350 [Novipirellula aureliae]